MNKKDIIIINTPETISVHKLILDIIEKQAINGVILPVFREEELDNRINIKMDSHKIIRLDSMDLIPMLDSKKTVQKTKSGRTEQAHSQILSLNNIKKR